MEGGKLSCLTNLSSPRPPNGNGSSASSERRAQVTPKTSRAVSPATSCSVADTARGLLQGSRRLSIQVPHSGIGRLINALDVDGVTCQRIFLQIDPHPCRRRLSIMALICTTIQHPPSSPSCIPGRPRLSRSNDDPEAWRFPRRFVGLPHCQVLLARCGHFYHFFFLRTLSHILESGKCACALMSSMPGTVM